MLDAAATDAAEARAVSGGGTQYGRAHAAAAAAADVAAAAAAAAAVADAAAGRSSLDGGPPEGGGGDAALPLGEQPMLNPRKLGLLMQLQRRWAGYQLRHTIATAAQGVGSSLARLGAARGLVSPFHPFGEQWYISEAGVVPPSEVPLDAPLSGASAEFAAANPGLINFHRMIAYRTRALTVISDTAAGLRRRGLRLPAPGPLAQPVRLGLILPPLVVEAAAARPQLLAAAGGGGAAAALPAAGAGGASQQQGPDGAAAAAAGVDAEAAPAGAAEAAAQGGGPSPSGTTTTSASAGAGAVPRGRRSPLAFLPGGRRREELVPLMVRVRGRGLDACKHVGLRAFGEAFLPVELSRAEAAPPADAPQGAWAALSSLQHTLTQRARIAAATVTSAVRGAPPPWQPPRGALGDLTLRVLLPRSTVARLVAAAAHTNTDAGARAEAPLVLQLQSDCQVVSAPVRLEPYIVGLLGTTPAAASLAAALLSGDAPLHAAAPATAAAAPATLLAAVPAAAVPAARWGPLQWLPWRRGAASGAPAPALFAAAPSEAQQRQLLLEERRRALEERRRQRRERLEAAASGGAAAPAWVEPWVAARPGAEPAAAAAAPAVRGSGPAAAPGQKQQRPHQQHGAMLPAKAGPPAPQPVASSSAGGRGAVAGSGTSRGGPGTSPRSAPALRSPLGPQPLSGATKPAPAAPVAAAPSARRRGRSGADALGGSSRLPAVASTLDEVQLSRDDAPAPAGGRPPLGRAPWAAAAGVIGGLRAPWGAAPAAARAQPAVRALASPGAAAPPGPPAEPAATPLAIAATRFVVLPPPGATGTAAAAPARGPRALLPAAAAPAPAPPPAAGAWAALDGLVVVADVDSVLLRGGAAAAPLAAAAGGGRAALALLLQPRGGAAAAVDAEAGARLRELLGDSQLPVCTLRVAGFHLGAPGAQRAGGWAAAAAALAPDVRAALAAQVAAARHALAAALAARGGDGGGRGWQVPPERRSKL
jgi:hypothetical protein